MLKFWLKSPLMEEAGEGQGGGGGTASFDPAAFQTGLLAEFNKVLNGALKAQKTEFTRMLEAVKPGASASGSGSGEGSGSGSGSGEGSGSGSGSGEGSGSAKLDPAVAAQLRAMERRLKESDDRVAAMKAESDAAKAAADKKELDATVRTKLNKFKFADEAAAEDAFEIFGSKIKRNEEGAFVGHDGTPIDQYLEEGMRSKPYLLAPKDVGGAGARNGKPGSGTKQFQLEDIKLGMKPEEIAAASAQIQTALNEALNRA